MKIKIFLIIFLIFLAGVFFVWQGIYLPKTPEVREEKVFVIKKGEGTREIAFNLEKQGIIKCDFLFRLYTLFKNVSGELQAGEYFLSPGMNTPEITKKIVSGKVIKEKITIIEGWNKREIANYLEEGEIVQSQDFLGKIKFSQWEDQYEFLRDRKDRDFYDRRNHGPIEDWDIEGYLFPDTYFVEKGISAENIISKMLDNFDKKLTTDLKEEIKKQKKSIFEIITMASLIEKEVKSFEDKKLVSGILWKRLKNNFPLQVDATITYITGKKTIKISKEDTQIDSPYNTYKYLGLPIGPICNPGIDSTITSIYPEESDFWYYLSTPEGETIFSKTLEEHNIAKAKYLK
ncbi:endolytic transglycosylase MltG [Patescibacteria group bacterium]|nr:endolytic transglycosylase MltG [Patescibacteria group bacterium]